MSMKVNDGRLVPFVRSSLSVYMSVGAFNLAPANVVKIKKELEIDIYVRALIS